MYQLFFTPGWFNGIDIAFEVISILVALSICFYSYHLYRISNENKFGYFALAFLSIAGSLLFKIITFANLYFTPVRDTSLDILRPLVMPGLRYANLFYRGGFFLHMTLMLGGLLLIFLISQKSRNRLHRFHEVSQIGLFLYFIVLVSVFSNFRYTVFYLTSSVLLSLIVLNYYKNYLNKRTNNALLVMMSFLALLASHLLFVFVFVSNELYVVAEAVQLVGFLLLLYAYRSAVRRRWMG
jgi:hypothetical protein